LYIILISANTEWQAVKLLFPGVNMAQSPYGEWFQATLGIQENSSSVIFFHGGWGKIAAAGSTQYVIDRWKPELIINMGTCGGFEGEVKRGTILLVDRTIVYDIYEQMGDHDTHIAHYTTELDLSWLSEPYPSPVQRTLLVSGDRDLFANEVPNLQSEYGAIAGDWESGAIAWVAKRNGVAALILRGVSDLVGPAGGEAYDGSMEVFHQNAKTIMGQLVEVLPHWLKQWEDLKKQVSDQDRG